MSPNAPFVDLKVELETLHSQLAQGTPNDVNELFAAKIKELGASGLADLAIKLGPVVVTFYRGSWCPFCNVQLRALQKYWPAMQAKGAMLVAITPELPDFTQSTVDATGLTFEVLSDVGMKVGKEYGVGFTMDQALQAVYKDFGTDLTVQNGDNTFKLPFPATYVIDTAGTITYAYVDVDYTKRAEPGDILKATP